MVKFILEKKQKRIQQNIQNNETNDVPPFDMNVRKSAIPSLNN